MARVRLLSLLLAVGIAAAACTEPSPARPRLPASTAHDDGWSTTPPPSGSTSAPGEPVPTALGSAAASGSKPLVRFDEQGKFARVLVVDEGTERHLRFGSVDAVNQSTISLSDPAAVPMDYIRVAFLGVLFAETHERALMVGLGGGTFTGQLRRHFPDMWIDVVEIDPVVVRAAKQHFGVKEDERYKIHIADGGAFVEQAAHRYDLALIDAYEGDEIPKHLYSPAFFQSLAKRMKPSGVAVLNLSVSDAIERVIEQRFRAAFAEVRCARAQWDGLELYGRPTKGLLTAAQLAERAKAVVPVLKPSFDLAEVASRVADRCPPQHR